MSTLLDAPPEHSTQTPHRRGVARARWRVAERLAWRQLRRNLMSSLLIGTLIMLPIAGMTAYAVIVMSMNGTPQQQARVELGEMDAWIAVAGVPDAGFWQAPTEPAWNGYPQAADGSMPAPEGTPIDDPTALLPTGIEALPIVATRARVDTAAGTDAVPAWTGNVWDPRFAGRFNVVDGRTPTSADEAMVTPAALDRLGVSLGEDLVLSESGDTFTIVGTLDAAELPDRDTAIFLPSQAALSGDTRWYLPTHDLNWADVQALNADGVVAYSRTVIMNPPDVRDTPSVSAYDAYWNMMWYLIVLLITAGLFAAYVVVMLAGAAFAVAARRQQRSLAVAASVGASTRDLRRTILLQGSALGIVGGAAGLILGVGVAALVMRLTANGSATQYWGFHIPWPLLGAILVFSVLVGTASAGMPARTVARSDTLSALRGARRPQTPKASRPIWGSIVLLLGVGITLGCAFLIASIATTDIPFDSPLRVVPPFGIVIGPILVQLGILLSGRWLLWLASLGLSRLGFAARLASRDAAANSSRTIPAFAAIAATVFIAVFAMGQLSMQNAQTARTWFYQAPLNSLAVDFYSVNTGVLTAEQAEQSAAMGIEVVEGAGAAASAVISRQDRWGDADSDSAEDRRYVLAVLPDEHLLDPESQTSFSSGGQDPSNPLSVIAPDELETALGTILTASQHDAYRQGAALVTDDRFVTDGTIDVAAWSIQDAADDLIPNNIWLPWEDGPALADPIWERTVEAIVVDLPLQTVTIAIAPQTAEALQIVAQPTKVIAALTAPLSQEEHDRMRAQAEFLSTPDVALSAVAEAGPPKDAFWIIPILVAVSVLVLGASAVALGLARFERRPDDATVAAIGGTRGLRRRIGFWQGLIIAGFGTLAGALAGVLPPIGFAIQSQGALQIADMPWIPLVGLAVALPVAIALVSWLVPPREPDLTRRTVIA